MGVWVNRNKYSPGKRHYYEGAERIDRGTRVKDYPTGRYTYHDYLDRTTGGPALCGARPLQNEGYTYQKEGEKKVYSGYGGLSVRENVSLLQSNLCSYCKKKLLESKPELKRLVEEMKQIQL